MFKRDLFTGELKEVETQCPETGRAVLLHAAPKEKRCRSVWSRPWISMAAGIPNKDQAAEFNAAMEAQGIRGAHIDPETGAAVCDSRQSRNAYLRFMNLFDTDPGYKDHVGTH